MAILAALVVLSSQAQVESWITATLPGGYTIDAPVKLQGVAVSSPRFKPTKVYSGDSGGVTFIAVASQTLGVATLHPDQLLAAQFQELLDVSGGVLTSQRDLLYRGWPGLEASFNSKDGQSGKYRAFAVGPEIVQCGCTWKGKAPAYVDRFMMSLAIPVKLGNGSLKKAGPEFTEYKWAGAELSLTFPRPPKSEEEKIASSGMKRVTLTAEYGNRGYVAMYTDLPDDAADHVTGQEKELRAFVAEQAIAGMPVARQKESEYKLNGVDIYSLTVDAKNGKSMRVDTFIVSLRVYGVLAVAPKPLIDSDEVKSFFKSMKITPLP